MDQHLSSFWGNVSHIGRVVVGAVKIVIASREVIVPESDPGLMHLRVTAGSKPTFLILESRLSRIKAVYNYPKADRKLAISLQTDLVSGRVTLQDLKDWDPDYLLEE